MKIDVKTIVGLSLAALGGLIALIPTKKVTSRKTEVVEVTVLSAWKKAATWEQKQSSTDSNAIVNYIPDKYYTQVMYKGERFTVADEVTFNRFCDRIGEHARAYMDITEYDDGSKSYDIISVF